MGDTQWENCGAETLLEEFFAQDDLRQLAESAGKMLDCPLLVLDDTFHVAAYRLPQGFSDELFQNVVSCGEITYEAGVLISRSPALSEGRADFLQLPGSPYPRRFALLASAGVQLGCLICVDTDGHLEKIPAQTWELVERILAKQLFVEASRQDKPFETAEDILMHLLDGGFSSAAYFQLQAANTYLADFHPRTFALWDLTAYRSVYAGKRRVEGGTGGSGFRTATPFCTRAMCSCSCTRTRVLRRSMLWRRNSTSRSSSPNRWTSFLTCPSFTPPPGKRWS